MSLTLGVFDSGFGGLTVLRSLISALPGVDFVYLGDTARLPYGSKSQATIARYAVSSAKFLEEKGADFLVIACNTASALALDQIRDSALVPVLGVIESGASAARAATKSGDVIVIGTQATVDSHAYARACSASGMRALELACPLLVPLVEEGWIDHPVTRQVVEIYLNQALDQAAAAGMKPDTVLLGCTHYPLLRPTIEQALPAHVQVIDSAHAIAERLRILLKSKMEETIPASKDELPAAESEPSLSSVGGQPKLMFYATDSVDKFRVLGASFLGQPIDRVRLLTLPE